MIQEVPNQPTMIPPAEIIQKAQDVVDFMTRDGFGRYWYLGGIASRALVEQLRSELAEAKALIARERAMASEACGSMAKAIAERDTLRAEVERLHKMVADSQLAAKAALACVLQLEADKARLIPALMLAKDYVGSALGREPSKTKEDAYTVVCAAIDAAREP